MFFSDIEPMRFWLSMSALIWGVFLVFPGDTFAYLTFKKAKVSCINITMLDKLKNRINQVAAQSAEAAEDMFNKIKLSEADRNARFDVCKTCEHLFKPTTTCKKCGCFMAVKTYIPEANCPLNKWSIMIENTITY